MTISKTKRAKLRLSSPSNCWYCGSSDTSTIDHVIPQHSGGSHDLDNLVLCCKNCNSTKKNLSVAEFRYKRSWDSTEYSKSINFIAAKKLIALGAKFPKFSNDHKFWFEGLL